MKTMIKVSIILAILITAGGMTVEAQRGYGHGPGRGYGPGHGHGYGPDSCHLQLMVNDLADELGLSDEQEAKILQLHYDHMAEMKSFRTEYNNDCVGEREARIASRNKLDENTKKVLTAEQAVKYDEIMADRRGPHKGPHHNWK